jgi:hypothetical protein
MGDLHVNMYYKALTLGQREENAILYPFTAHGVRLKPFAPVHLSGWAATDGSGNLSWIRRTRLSAPWRNTVDAPLGEQNEKYVVQIWNSTYTSCARVTDILTAANFEYTAAMQVTDFGAIQETIYWSVMQLGKISAGYEAFGSVRGVGATNGIPLIAKTPYNSPPPVPSLTGGTQDERHLGNFALLMGTDRQLAYKYANLGLVMVYGNNWFGRHQFQIIDEYFNGDTNAWALWIQDADTNRMVLSDADLSYLNTLARAAIFGE